MEGVSVVEKEGGSVSGLFGQTVNPNGPTNLYNQAYGPGGSVQEQQFLSDLAIQTMGRDEGGLGQFVGLKGYGGPTSPDVNNTMLPSVYNNWQPWNAGTGYLAAQLGQPGGIGKPSPQMEQYMNNIGQYGGMGGYPTQLMTGMAQYGGTGGLGNKSMSNLAQFGAASAAGQPMADMAKTGVSGSWGNPLLARATGAPTAASNYLTPFLTQGTPYRAAWKG